MIQHGRSTCNEKVIVAGHWPMIQLALRGAKISDHGERQVRTLMNVASFER